MDEIGLEAISVFMMTNRVSVSLFQKLKRSAVPEIFHSARLFVYAEPSYFITNTNVERHAYNSAVEFQYGGENYRISWHEWQRDIRNALAGKDE